VLLKNSNLRVINTVRTVIT